MSERVERLASAIDRFSAAAVGCGGAAPSRLTETDDVEADVEAIDEAIRPRRLPPEIEWFWNTWDPRSFGLLTGHPHFTDPAFALRSTLADETWPRAVFPIAYESHCFLAVELDYDDSPAGRVYYYCYADDGFRVRVPDLAALFDSASTTIEAGDVEGLPDGSAQLAGSVQDRYAELVDAAGIALDERGPFDPYEVLSWPRRWQTEQGVSEAAGTPRGATCTIRELEDARRLGPVSATIAGRADGGGGSGEGELVVVRDATGTVDVWIPSSVPSLGRSETNNYEYDVLAEPLESHEQSWTDLAGDHAEVTRLALQGDIEAAGAAATPFSDHLSGAHPVVASAVRPL